MSVGNERPHKMDYVKSQRCDAGVLVGLLITRMATAILTPLQISASPAAKRLSLAKLLATAPIVIGATTTKVIACCRSEGFIWYRLKTRCCAAHEFVRDDRCRITPIMSSPAK
jgi:hypothetical protein